MAIKSVYVRDPAINKGIIRIKDDEHRHLSVARAGVDEGIEIVDGRGGVWDAVIVALERRETVARITGQRQAEPDRHELFLGQSLIRTSAFELALEKAVETGVTRIIPVIAARSNVKDAGRPEHRMDRWRKIIVEAAKQSKRYYVPALDEPLSFAKVLDIEARTKIVFAERNGAALKSAIVGTPVLYLIGPEGGWTDTELGNAQDKGFAMAGLGSTILKSETAAVVATSLLRYELESSAKV